MKAIGKALDVLDEIQKEYNRYMVPILGVDTKLVNARQSMSDLQNKLKSIEYIDNTPSDIRFKFCPACQADIGHGHDEDCWLAKALGGD